MEGRFVGAQTAIQEEPEDLKCITAHTEARNANFCKVVAGHCSRLPGEHRLPRVKRGEHGDALGLNDQQISKAELIDEQVLFPQLPVDETSWHNHRLLRLVEPLSNPKSQVVVVGSHPLELGIEQLPHPRRITWLDRAIDTNPEVHPHSIHFTCIHHDISPPIIIGIVPTPTVR